MYEWCDMTLPSDEHVILNLWLSESSQQVYTIYSLIEIGLSTISVADNSQSENPKTAQKLNPAFKITQTKWP